MRTTSSRYTSSQTARLSKDTTACRALCVKATAGARHPHKLADVRTYTAASEEVWTAERDNGGTSVQQLTNRHFTDANFPVDDEGRTYHLGTKRGEVAQRILSVGSSKRAMLLAEQLDSPCDGCANFMAESSRGFLTITGCYRGTPVSIVSTLMGQANMDFVVRENRAVVDGPIAIIRLGTCGVVQHPGRLGTIVVAYPGSISIRRDPDAFGPAANGNPKYHISRPVPADEELASGLVEALGEQIGRENVLTGLNASADSFYSSQGRTGRDFEDHNEPLLAQLLAAHPGLLTLEMETFHLLDLARCSAGRSIRAAAACIPLAERRSNAFLDPARVTALERAGGAACLAALAGCQLAEPARDPAVHYVWGRR